MTAAPDLGSILPPQPTPAAAVGFNSGRAVQQDQPSTRLAPWLAALLEANAVLAVLTAVAALYRRAQMSGDLLAADIRRADRLVIVMSRTELAFGLVTGVLYLVWSYRAARDRNRIEPTTWSPAFAVAAWFIPVANVVMPAKVLADVVRPLRRRLGWVVAIWWILLALSALLPLAGQHPQTIAEFRHRDDVTAIAQFLRAGAALVLARIVMAARDLSQPGGLTDPANG